MNTKFTIPLSLCCMLLFSLVLSGCGQIGSLFATETPTMTASWTPRPTRTFTPTRSSTPTLTPNATRTALYNAMLSRVQEYASAGYIPSTQGEYFRLDDYTGAWANLLYYYYDPTGFKVRDFIVRTHVYWQNAALSNPLAGCGFVFRRENTDVANHYLVFVTPYHTAMLYTNIGGEVNRMGSVGSGYPPGEKSGDEILTLAVSGSKISLFLNDTFKRTFEGSASRLAEGSLDFAVLSGTNADFGTRCSFTEVELWSVDH